MGRYMNIRELVESFCRENSPRTAFKIKHKNGKEISYEDITFSRLFREVTALGKFFANNFEENDTIAVVGKNCYEWMLVYLAVLSAGRIIVPLDRALPSQEMESQLERANVKAVFYTEDLKAFYNSYRDAQTYCMNDDNFKSLIESSMALDSTSYDNTEIDIEKTSLILFTSGTTSKSKAVMLSQKNIVSNVIALKKHVTFYNTDVNMALLPFHHGFGMTQIVLFLSIGICNVFCEGLRIARCLKEYRVTILVCVPRIADEIMGAIQSKLKKTGKDALVNTMATAAGILNRFKIDIRRRLFKKIINELGGGLRLIIIGAAPATPAVLKRFNEFGILTIQGYGLTEASPVLCAESDRIMRLGSIGKPLPDIDIRIDSPDENGIGEIIAKGDNIMNGYYKDEESTNAVLKNGYFHTGDMGYFDKDGFLYITGRKKNVIVLSNGKNVFPEELELVISQCEAVKECIVSQKDGELHSKIVYKTDYDEETAKETINKYIETMNESLVSYKQIHSVEFTDKEFEKTTTLKIKR
ncbi:MAG: AMP-binding protein [Clostridia bacterium]|nr:AMP-binding protein [Clostridia bacterium]